ncbi:hypothetical protein LTR17_016622 [Elasticomyces elasticus]|nr:hypothetical protein LTR17_016622 [Elasticomyces elasticus]
MAGIAGFSSSYQPLDASKQEIRVLHLLPARRLDAPIYIQLKTVSLQDNPYYEALSYTWGNASDTSHIWVLDPQSAIPGIVSNLISWVAPVTRAPLNSIKTPVTRSLHGALRRLRLAHRTRVVWADAICINQADIAEKNVQVSMMGDIYKEADCVNIWLGEDSSPHTQRWRDLCLQGSGRTPEQDRKTVSQSVIRAWGVTTLVSPPLNLLDKMSTTLLRICFRMLGFVRAQDTAKQTAFLTYKSDVLFRAYMHLFNMEIFIRKGAMKARRAFADALSYLLNKSLWHQRRGWQAACMREYDADESIAEQTGRPPHSTNPDSESTAIAVRALYNLLSRPWFTRLWVIQEIILAKRADFIIGSSVLPFRTIATSANKILCMEAADRIVLEWSVLDAQEVETFAHAKPLLSLLKDVSRTVTMQHESQELSEKLWAKKREYHQYVVKTYTDSSREPPIDAKLALDRVSQRVPPHPSAFMVLSGCGGQQCTDERDRVYALLSITTLSPHVQVDYAKPVEDVYIDAAAALLRNDELFSDVLYQACQHSRVANGIPSWVPDWRTASLPTRWPEVPKCYNASTIPEPFFRIVENSRLEVKVLFVDRIDSCLPKDHRRQALDPSPSISDLTELGKTHLQLQIQSWRQWLDDQSSETFWRVALQDVLSDGKRLATADCNEFELVYHRDLEGNFTRPKLALGMAHKTHIETIGMNYQPCRTDRGLVGSVGLMANVGDRIYVIAGSPMPFLLRPVPDQGPKHFRVVGLCYLVEIMDGEAVSEAMRVQGKEQAMDVFEDITLV